MVIAASERLPAPAVAVSAARDPVRKQLRGSSLLLVGRFLSMAINFASQTLIVRYLSTEEYGAFAYALAVVAFWDGFSTLGLRRGITRFIPLYQEKADFGRIAGTLWLALGATVLTSGLSIAGVHGFQDLVSRFVHDPGGPVELLLILIFLVPVQAVDELLLGLFACFSRPKAIFYRKHVLGPLFKLGVVLVLVLFRTDVRFLAYGYLAANTLAALLYAGMFLRLMQQEGLDAPLRQARVQVPYKEIFAFSIPLLTTNLVAVAMHSADTMILGYFHPSAEVARYRAILPAAHLNTLVLASFGILFTPAAARLFARGDYAGINTLYWRSAVWMAVFSFPIFALTFCTARSLTVSLYGERYASSALLLQLFAVAYYFGTALGNNGLTLKVVGKLRYVVVVNVLAMLVNVLLALLIIPAHGALGAAAATSISMILHNVFKQTGLASATGTRFIEWRYAPVYAVIGAAALVLLVAAAALPGDLWLSLPLVALVSLLVIVFARRWLEVEDSFPELLRLPVLGWLLRERRHAPPSQAPGVRPAAPVMDEQAQ